MRALVIFCIIGIIGTSSISLAFAPCCFPWDITFHTDPETGFLLVSGDLWNDSYISEPFGNVDYKFRFTDENNEILFERNVLITDRHPIDGGFEIPPTTVFPFQFVIDDVDPEIINKVTNVSHGGTNNLEYFGWKPADLRLELNGFEPIEQIHQNGQDFTEWKITGTITNTNSDPTENVYVLASMYGEDQNLVGVAGYSDLDVQPLTLDGFGKKDFTLIEQIPSQKIPVNVSLYAESDDSSMVYKYYMPIILKDATDHTKKISKEYKQPIPIIANITNISRENFNFDWIIQIKKSPVSASQGDLTNYPESEVIEIHTIPSFIGAQDNDQLEFFWVPPSGGIYFYEEFIWNDSKPESLPFKGSFISDNWIMVDYSDSTLKNQLKSGVPFDKLECINDLILILKKDGTHACVKPASIEKLIERNWTTAEIMQEIAFKNMSKAFGPECSENSMQDIINGIIDDKCRSYLTKLADEHRKEMMSQGYSFDSGERKWVKEGYPDTMMTIVDYYLQIQAPSPPPKPEPMTEAEMSLLKAKKDLKYAYQNQVNLGPYYLKDVILGIGSYNDILIIDISSDYTGKESIQIIKDEIEHIIGKNVKVDYSIYDQPIAKHIETVIPYLWNKILHKQNIEFTPKDQVYANNDDGFLEHDKVCSPLLAPNGTEFYIYSTFDLEPFEITGTFIDHAKPDDCHKVWRTDVIMIETDRVTALWLENEG